MKKELSGQRFGRLTVIEEAGRNKNQNVIWSCRCDCGNITTALTSSLISGNTRSCGCLHKETFSAKKHGKRNTRLYRIWYHMRERCNNKNAAHYSDYGGRGITVCKDWDSGFQPFYEWATSNGYKDGLTIDRVDNNKGYSPDNCRWATYNEQARNKRNNLNITYNGKTQTLKEWANELGIRYTTLWQRLYKRGLSIEKAFKTP